MRVSTILSSIALSSVLVACGPATPEDERAASIAKCDRQFGRMAPDPSKGTALCSCLVDNLAEQGLEITDVFGSDRAKIESATRSCAAQVGIPMPA